MSWTEDNLLAAMRQGDEQTVRLFMDGGWKFASDKILSVVALGDDIPFAAVMAVARARAFVDTRFCKSWSSDRDNRAASRSYYISVDRLTSKPERWAVFLSLCGKEALRTQYDALISVEWQALAEQHAQSGRQAGSPRYSSSDLERYQRIRGAL